MFNIVEKFISPITDLIGKAIPDKDKAMEVTAELNKLGSQLESQVVDAQTKVMVAELQQDDLYTKRARPSVIYIGLGALVLNHILLPWITFAFGADVPEIVLPEAFWYAWGGVVGTYAYSRGKEKIKKLL